MTCIYLLLFFCFSHIRRCTIILSVSVVFFKQKTAYEMRISDWSSDVCSSDLRTSIAPAPHFLGNRNQHQLGFVQYRPGYGKAADPLFHPKDRKSVVKGKSVSVRVDLGGRRLIKKQNSSQVKGGRKTEY